MRFETHSHSHYSNIRLIDSICKPRDLILKAYELGYAGIALTDHEALCGHIEWLELEQELKEKNLISKDFKCALGNEIYLVNERGPKQKYWHFLLIAKNEIGHRALRELSSNSWINSYVDRGLERVPTLYSELEAIVHKYPNSLIADSACLGSKLDTLVLELVQAEESKDTNLICQKKIEINDFLIWSKNLFGDDFYIEIAPGVSTDQRIFNKRIKPIADFYHIKMVIGCDAHYLTAEYREIHKAFLNSKEGEREVDSFYHDAHLMSDEEAYANLRFFYTPEDFQQMCNNSLEIMNKIEEYHLFHNSIIPEVEVNAPDPFVDTTLKDYPTLYGLRASENPQEREWITKCLASLKDRDKINETYLNRLELEADILKTIGNNLGNCMFAYFNTFKHYIDLFWECGSIVGPGRGSSGGFLSNYLLNITQLDPIEWNLPWFRFLNKDRAELPDIDVDLAPSKRPLILQKIREERGELNVLQVATFGTASARTAIAAACRGYRSKYYPKGIDIDISSYFSSLIPSERGLSWTLTECFDGSEEKDRKPIKELVLQFEKYPGLKEIALGIEGLVMRRGQHASGVILYNKTPYETAAIMKSPNGDLTTQYDLHRAEKAGDTKFDFLVTDICDKLAVAIELLQKNGYFQKDWSLRQIYNKYLHPSVINLKNPRIWEALANGEVQDVFQFNTAIGIQTARTIQPHSPTELTAANGLMRLVAPEGQERPFDRYVKFKNNIQLWYDEMTEAGLTKEEQKTLEPYYKQDYGVPCSQEALMRMVMDPKISNFTLAEANQCRKVLAKKKVKEIPIIQEKFLKQCPTVNLGQYCWTTMMLPQMSYSFSMIHSLLYSFIGIQTLVIATEFPIIYWNTACLIVNAQAMEDSYEDSVDEEEPENEEEENTDIKRVQKKKAKTTNYDKISTAIGKMAMAGILVAPPDINTSSYTFSPDEQHDIIRFGLCGITRLGKDKVKEILSARPFNSINDFLEKVKVNKTQMINLIKSGAFDNFGERSIILKNYIKDISGTKKRITLQNMKMLIDFGLIPNEYDFVVKVFNFNKYLKKFKNSADYDLDNIAFNFYEKNFDINILDPADTESGFKIKQIKWDNIYKKQMDKIRPFIKEKNEFLLNSVNEKLIRDIWDKDCKGNYSKWEMDSLSCYIHEHELEFVDNEFYEISNFGDLPEVPPIEKYLFIKGKQIPIYRLARIAGTVLSKDKMRKTISLLTTDGVVDVKIYGVFPQYDKQVSEVGVDGKKHVIRKSEFSRGNKIIVTGIREGDGFRAKKYSKTPFHLIETISQVNEDGTLEINNRQDEV